MLLTLIRDVFHPDWTLSRLSITYDRELAYGPDHVWRATHPHGPLDFGFVVEDQDRGLSSSMSPDQIRRLKVPKETAIPTGRYQIRRTWSPKYGRLVMEVCDVPGYRGIRIHPGNDDDDTEGCLLPATARDVRRGTVSPSTPAVEWLDERVKECEARGEAVYINIVRDATAWAARSSS